jgi:O-antigen/teichoic acid export membrane protein
MKVIARKIHLKHPRILEWTKLIAVTGSAQITVQALTLIGGMLIIRYLPTKEYALYTIAYSFLGTMTVLSDGGVATGVMAQGGKIWRDKEKLGSLLSTGLYLRKKLAIGTLLICIPLLAYMLHSHGASWMTIALIATGLTFAFVITLSGTLLTTIVRLHQDIKSLQKIQVSAGASRLVMIVGALFFLPLTFVLILVNGISQLYANNSLRKVISNYADRTQPPNAEYKTEILKIVKRILPSAVYFSFLGQITIWLVSIIGNTSTLAQAGALSRLSMTLTVFTILISTLIVPRFARLPANREALLKNYLGIHLGVLLVCIGIVLATFLFPSQILWILGNQYSNLSHELLLSIIGSCLNIIVGTSFSLYSNRGWVVSPMFGIPVNLLVIVLCIKLLDLSTLSGVLILNLVVELQNVVFNFVFGLYKIYKTKSV